ncbi:MAG: SDR family oxidoreductase [Blastocatellia bacterium]|nr:SDR family oxidoreductase [Blastocatellia bacterium]
MQKADWDTCLEVLTRVIDDPSCALDLEKIERLATNLYKKARKRNRKEAASNLTEEEQALRQERSKQDRQENYIADQQIIASTSIARVHKGEKIEEQNTELKTTSVKGGSKSCYCCGKAYREIHFFYHKLCFDCAEFNYKKRNQKIDLTGYYSLVTGGRIKIGFQTALKLLRDNATVMVTTRFAQDALERFSKEPDFKIWQDRLFIQPLDFRDLHSLLSFINYLEIHWPALDILVNNAAQTVSHEAEFYKLETEKELKILSSSQKQFSSIQSLAESKQNLNLVQNLILDLDRHGQPIDKREKNSWTLKLHEVEVRELLEVLLINTAAPCILTAKLKPLFLKSKNKNRFVVNVCGLDAQFNRINKTSQHPHVNMSKAALNMMTRTSASDYAEDNIFMNSVDTGWITHEGSYSKREQMRLKGFVPPLDEVDGAARIYDPIVSAIKHQVTFGKLFRNYLPVDW